MIATINIRNPKNGVHTAASAIHAARHEAGWKIEGQGDGMDHLMAQCRLNQSKGTLPMTAKQRRGYWHVEADLGA